MNTDERRAKVAAQSIKNKYDWKLMDGEAREIARAIRESDEAAGMVLRPKVATEDMKHAGAYAIEYPTVRMEGPMPGSKIRAGRIYDAMIAAAEGSRDPRDV